MHLWGERSRLLGTCAFCQGVATDPSKIAAVKEWPIPTTVKQLRGFLGLTGYYRRFVKHYGQISKPLTDLLRKNTFHWDDNTQQAFDHLKEAMVTAPVLALPNFSKTFVVETYASGTGLGAVLMQEGHPIAYFSKGLSPRHHSLSTYAKELMAVVLAVEKWRPYLLGRHFIIKTDHFSLKYLLGQKFTTVFQSKWLPKLMGYDHEIHYRQGKENLVADGLSRLYGMQLLTFTLNSISSELLAAIKATWLQDPSIQQLIQTLESGQQHPKYVWQQGMLYRKGKLVVGADPSVRQQLLQLFHDSSIGGHSSIQVTKKRLASVLYWKGLTLSLIHI